MDLRGMTARELATATEREREYSDDDELDTGSGVDTPPLTEAYVSMLLSGKRSAARSASTRQRIADALDVPIDWIEVERPADEGAGR